ncbi:flagellar motor protein PomA [Saccharophagus degradans]|uniref:MotA/TolQ/ExbB proton channel n=2 Tax=Saccharophagus degradans TaxID=86304 RepID=Q21FQ3_SACD2|nr:flagellar motor protein PomA [Saccharophagus degradans]ABD82476.1 MotA/TolQ/ExbB proton channel [Saccharophagus degradans 2-40]MBU2985330.1 flagellar motor protein PomA [Saccharophagus degradans]MDO6421411.1 flagellar motor protein PomA [Saccharophagus degradans]MDO6608775.1 flagellar motor protein PomA [Saccharophagus degradans]WGO99329.1 flagellar motor protein PomA [Saccharophagus degradans]
MDLATIVGLIGACALIVIAMLMSGELGMFVNGPSLVIVFGGTIFACMAKFSLGTYLSAMKIAGKSFTNKLPDPNALIEEVVALADEARKGGLLSLEGKEVSSDFLQRGIQLLVDGHDPDVVKALLSKDKNQAVERHNVGATIFASMADMAPAMGMIGTLIGLVAMLANMDDPKAIGPAMAVALLTTLYGAVIANALCGPIADKLKQRAIDEAMIKSLVIDALIAIQNGQNPRVIDSLLRNYLPEGKREVADAD